MISSPEIEKFNRGKIFEKLKYQPQPLNYNLNIPWVVQQQIAATNGVHYVDRIGRLEQYPVYELPTKRVDTGLMLDIGCGWGRWLVAGSNKGYLPVGIDLRLEFCETARQVLSDFKINGYTVVADLENLPFQDDTFNLVWSFSVIQHTHIERLRNCLLHINRILAPAGQSLLEFPNRNGIRNHFISSNTTKESADDFNNWCVRYYSPSEYRLLFEKYLANFSFSNHSFLGIGILKEDLKYVSLKNKIICSVSLFGSQLARIVPGLKYFSDSIYISAGKRNRDEKKVNKLNARFWELHESNPTDNLNIASLLRCPITSEELVLSEDRTKLVAEESRIYYPVVNEIPILVASEAERL